MNTFTQTIVVIAALAGLVVAGFYISDRVTCWHIPYITSSCIVK